MHVFLIVLAFLIFGLLMFRIVILFNAQSYAKKFNIQTFPAQPDIFAGFEIESHPLEKYYGLLTEEQFEKFIVLGNKISEDEINLLDEKLKIRTLEDQILEETIRLNNIGLEAENKNNIEMAITCYEQSIGLEYPITHAYNRLIKLYSKMNKRDDQLRILNFGITNFKHDQRFKDRLEEWEMLKSKLTSPIQNAKITN